MQKHQKTIRRFWQQGMAALFALTLAACGSDDTATPPEEAWQPWQFAITTDGLTRGMPETTLSKSVGMAAYVFENGGALGAPDYMWNEEVTKSGTGWCTSNGYAKPQTDKSIKFLAYYPYTAQSGTPAILLSDNTTAGPLAITYEVPQDVADQQDVMTGESAVLSTSDRNDLVQMTLHHRLSAIQFVTGDIGLSGKIKSISLKNIHKKGTYRLGDNAWTLQGGTNGVSFTVSPDYVVEHITLASDADGRQPVATNENSFLMLPQAIPDDAKMVIEYEATIDGTTAVHTLEANLKNSTVPEWQWGKIYTYQISVVSLALEYEVVVHDWELGGVTDVQMKI